MPQNRWTGDELVKALDMYLSGSGTQKIAQELNRDSAAVDDVIRHDIPRNYRNVIGLIPFATSSRRAGSEWSLAELNLLTLLLRKHRTAEDISLVLGRPVDEVIKKTEESKPKRPRGAKRLEDLGE